MTLFITGTDTNIGKTIISAWICLHTRMPYWKPIQTGISDSRDTDVVQAIARVETYPETYALWEPLSPHAAAIQENMTIDPSKIIKPTENSLVIEGAGGVLVPLAPDVFLIDLIQQWTVPVLIVARSSLGTINHTCLTIEALRNRNIPILGVILNGIANPINRQAIETYGNCPVLAEFPPLQAVSAEGLSQIPLPSCLGGYKN
jgi:dethiobiotin synthetase